ncbi:MAG: hypothetical protein JNJ58_06480 [Chitinophagaceae bacterium]|nr:hypothetical protein [Chitinophagaceae bacterium]
MTKKVNIFTALILTYSIVVCMIFKDDSTSVNQVAGRNEKHRTPQSQISVHQSPQPIVAMDPRPSAWQ